MKILLQKFKNILKILLQKFKKYWKFLTKIQKILKRFAKIQKILKLLAKIWNNFQNFYYNFCFSSPIITESGLPPPLRQILAAPLCTNVLVHVQYCAPSHLQYEYRYLHCTYVYMLHWKLNLIECRLSIWNVDVL